MFRTCLRTALALLGMLLVVPVMSLVSPPSASAATQCQFGEDDIGTPTRNCKYDTSISGGRLQGFAWWTYDNPRGNPGNEKSGRITATVRDAKGDGHCAQAKLTLRSKKYPSYNETVWQEACGYGSEKSFTHPINADYGRHRNGTYAISLCVDRTNCVRVWHQAINAQGPG